MTGSSTGLTCGDDAGSSEAFGNVGRLHGHAVGTGDPGRAELQWRARRPPVPDSAAARERRGAGDRTKRLAPQVLVVRLTMPGLSGPEVTRQVRDQVPATSVVILSMYATELHAAQGLQHGAAGYVVMAAPGRDLVKAVRAAGSGRRYLSPPLTTRGVDAHLQRTLAGAVDLYEALTTREREVLHLASDGYGNPQVAAILGISTRTAETHRAHLMHKLGLRSQTELVRYAIERGIGSPVNASTATSRRPAGRRVRRTAPHAR